MKNILDSYLVAILILIIGIVYIRSSLNERKKGNIDWSDHWQGYLNGWFAGIGAVILAVLIFLIKLGVIKG